MALKPFHSESPSYFNVVSDYIERQVGYYGKMAIALFFILLCLLPIGCISYSSFDKCLTYKIDSSWNKVDSPLNTSLKKYMRNDRRYLYKKGYLNFINYKEDTFFVAQNFSISSGNLYTDIWNKKDKIALSNNGDTHNKYKVYVGENIIDSAQMNIIMKWNIQHIKQLNNEYGNTFHNSIIYISRIIINGDTSNIESISINTWFMDR